MTQEGTDPAAGAANAATFRSAPICAREGCGKPFERRRGGKPQQYCSRRCRSLDWEAHHPRISLPYQEAAPLDKG